MPIRKRRPVKQLNKNEEGLRRRETEARGRQSVGTLHTRFPTVRHLNIQLEFVTREGHSLGSELRSFEPDSLLSFTADCPGRCGNGRMDVEAVVSQMINNRQPSRDSQGFCKQTLFAGSSEVCGCELRCKLTAEYFPAEA